VLSYGGCVIGAVVFDVGECLVDETREYWTRLGSRSWTFDRLNTLTCGFTSQVDEICALE
jgi:hypothetical protein